MNRLLIVAIAVGLLLVSVSAQAAPRNAEQVAVTDGWAGYVVRTGGGSFEQVRGSWVQPRIVCNRPGSSAAFWVGLGGADADSEALEQVGTSANCSEGALLSTSAWYQLFPAPPVVLPLTIRAGDTLTAELTVRGSRITVALRDVSTGASFSNELWTRSPETDSAEWIVEAPSACFTRCAPLPLADFDRVAFTDASATVGTHSGPIGDPAWSRQRVEMSMSRGRRTAVPTRLAANVLSFVVIGTQGRALHAGTSQQR